MFGGHAKASEVKEESKINAESLAKCSKSFFLYKGGTVAKLSQNWKSDCGKVEASESEVNEESIKTSTKSSTKINKPLSIDEGATIADLETSLVSLAEASFGKQMRSHAYTYISNVTKNRNFLKETDQNKNVEVSRCDPN